jgi:hypothetical protein
MNSQNFTISIKFPHPSPDEQDQNAQQTRRMLIDGRWDWVSPDDWPSSASKATPAEGDKL